MKKNIFYTFIFLILLFFCNVQNVLAQQTIITVPSSELVPTGDLFLKDSNRFGTFSNGTNVSVTPSVTLGTGWGTQLSTGVSTSLDRNKRGLVKNDLSIKKVWFLGNSTRLTTGATVSPYLNQAVHPDTFIYAHLSQKIPKTRTTLTAGAYMNGSRHFLDTGGVILGVEQVLISNKLRLAADWMSGQDSLGRMGVGLKYRPTPTLSITSAVLIPNRDSDNIGFNISVSKFIALDDENPIKRRLKNVD